jgi:hypothetical protein
MRSQEPEEARRRPQKSAPEGFSWGLLALPGSLWLFLDSRSNLLNKSYMLVIESREEI